MIEADEEEILMLEMGSVSEENLTGKLARPHSFGAVSLDIIQYLSRYNHHKPLISPSLRLLRYTRTLDRAKPTRGK